MLNFHRYIFVIASLLLLFILWFCYLKSIGFYLTNNSKIKSNKYPTFRRRAVGHRSQRKVGKETRNEIQPFTRFNFQNLILTRYERFIESSLVETEWRFPSELRMLFYSPALGLGNKMFIYMAGKSLAKALNRTFVYCSEGEDIILKTFQIATNENKELTDYHCRKRKGYLTINLPYCCVFQENLYNLPFEHIVFNGFFQSWKYFSVNDAKKEFQFREQYVKEARLFHDDIKNRERLAHDTKVIGIHVRRGDMLLPRNKAYGHKTADKAYLEKAMSYYKSKYHSYFIVASDDLLWCKETLRNYEAEITYTMNENMVDLAILSLCDHMILTVGTFGWWAGMLIKGEVLYFKNWPRNGSAFKYSVNHEDYFPRNWIGL